MASTSKALLASLVVVCWLALCCHASEVLFSSLQHTLVVTSSTKEGDVMKAGEGEITVTWALNQSFPAGTDSEYKSIKLKLCYAPVSQVERAWRKTVDKISKDKTCQFKITSRPYNASNGEESFKWVLERDVPTASFFVRAYAYNTHDHEVAYGQTTDDLKTTNIFIITSITGRHLSLDIASVVFSAFSVLSLAFFFVLEKKKAKRSL